MRSGSFFDELKRRNVYKVAVAYAVVAWLLLQALSILLPAFEAPPWVMRVFIAAIVAGFPLALIFAWAFELTPDGVKRTDEVPINESIAPKTGRKLLVTVGVIVLLAAGLLVFQLTRGRAPEISQKDSGALPAKSIAVLPFASLSEDKANAYFADGIQDEILTRLAKIGELKVISRTSTQHYKSAPENLRRIATELGVAHILEGSAQRSADHVRVNVQLINAASDTHLWAETYDRKLTDVFAVESEIAAKIADSLRAKISGAEQKGIAVRPTESNEAHDLYLRGRFFAAKRTAGDFKKAIDYFDQAIAKDQSFALAYASLAESYALLPEWSDEPANESFQKAKAAADKAVAIDDNVAEAHTALALVFHGAALNFREAEREFEHAIALNPNSATAHYFYGITVLASLGEFDRAIVELKRALELDPLSAIASANLGYCYIQARRYPEAIAQLRRTVPLDPDLGYSHAMLGIALALDGQMAEATDELQKGYQSTKAYQTLVTLAYFYAAHGEREKATELLQQFQQIVKQRPVWAYFQALMSIASGDKAAAIDWLERSYLAKETGAITYIKVDPLLDPLRGDPRFEALVARVLSPKTP